MITYARNPWTPAAALLLLLMCGCIPSFRNPEPPTTIADAVSNWRGAGPPQQVAPAPGADQPLPLLPPKNLPMNDQISLMYQRLASCEDDRKVLASRLHMCEMQLEEKEKALAMATREIQETTGQIVRARNELQQWKKDMSALRDRLGSMEKDNRETLETMIKTLEQVLDRDRSQAKGVENQAPDLLPPPKRLN